MMPTALSMATVGIAFGEFSDITAQAAGAVIMESQMSKVDELLHLCLQTRTIALQSGLLGMILSVIGMACAAAGYLSPIMGAIVQEIIDVLAMLNALRLTFQPKIQTDLSS
jgi:cation transport ATPase